MTKSFIMKTALAVAVFAMGVHQFAVAADLAAVAPVPVAAGR